MTENNIDLFKNLGVEVTLKDDSSFLKIVETLTRIGVASNPKNGQKLFQSCHLLHKQGRYAIMHFKEMFKIDGKISTITESDINRRNFIAKLLQEWDLLTINDEDISKNEYRSSVKIIPFSKKNEWELIPKYSIGVKK